MGIFDRPPRMVTEEEKKANIEKYRVVRPLAPKPEEVKKEFERKAIPKNDPELAKRILEEKRNQLFGKRE